MESTAQVIACANPDCTSTFVKSGRKRFCTRDCQVAVLRANEREERPESEKVRCGQCEREFIPKSRVNIYCNKQCSLDHAAGRSAEESRRRRETGFAWDPIRPAPVVRPKVPKVHAYQKLTSFGVAKGWKTALLIPDQQFGYRRNVHTGVLDPFHDPRAIEIVEMIAEAERPDIAVMLGDVNDLPNYGRFRQEPAFVGGVQPGLDRASVHVANISELVDETRIIKGNHDERIENHTMDNALASHGLRRARRRPNEFPVLTVEFLLGTEEMKNVTWVQGYPAGATYLNDNFACIHGRATGKSLVEKVINSERVSVAHGHTHGYYDGVYTFNHRGKPLFVRAHSPGCVCRIDGAVPSSKGGVDVFGRPVKSWENWQQGCTIVRYLEDGSREEKLEHIEIREGWAMHRGQEFVSLKAVDDPELELLPLQDVA